MAGLNDLKVVPLSICSFSCCALIFGIIALPFSFKSLPQVKYALQLNWHTQEISDEVVTEPGLYFVGLGNMLVEFPSTFQTMYFIGDTRGIIR